MYEWPERKTGNHGLDHTRFTQSESFRKAITDLEELDGMFVFEKILILLTAIDLKPASIIDIQVNSDKRAAEDVMRRLGLFFELDPVRTEFLEKNNFQRAWCYWVGNTKESLAEVQKHSSLWNSQSSGDFGRAVGYPHTAVSAFERMIEDPTEGARALFRSGEEPVTKEERVFLSHRMSRENFEQEIQWTEQIAAAVKHWSPRLYKEAIRMYSEE